MLPSLCCNEGVGWSPTVIDKRGNKRYLKVKVRLCCWYGVSIVLRKTPKMRLRMLVKAFKDIRLRKANMMGEVVGKSRT